MNNAKNKVTATDSVCKREKERENELRMECE